MAPIDEALFAQFHANLVSNLPDQNILENIITYYAVLLHIATYYSPYQK
jgi:hypothetical protein